MLLQYASIKANRSFRIKYSVPNPLRLLEIAVSQQPSNWVHTTTSCYHQNLQHDHVHVSIMHYASLLNSSSNASSIPYAMHMHHLIIKDGIEKNPYIQNPLLHMYCRCGALDEANAFFIQHTTRNAYSWDFLIRAYIENRCVEKVVNLFERMHHESIMPDKVIYANMLSGCGGDVIGCHIGIKIHARIIGSMMVLHDIVLRTTLVTFYNKCDRIHDAKAVIYGHYELDEVLCNAMIESYIKHGCDEDALHMYEQMQWEGFVANGSTFISLLSMCVKWLDLSLGKQIHTQVINTGWDSDVCVATALVSMYGRCGDTNSAQKLFSDFDEKDLVIWNAMITTYAQNRVAKNALLIYAQMHQEALLPNRVTHVSVLQACATDALSVQGKQVHACIVKNVNIRSELVVENVLISMYGNCGQIEYAQSIFEQMNNKDVVSWSSMIGACSQHGHSMRALQVLYEMDHAGVTPNEGTLVNVISAHTNSSTHLSQCRYLHSWIIANGHVCAGETGNALITMYAKNGNLEDAKHVFDHLVEKGKVSWNALISGYAQNGYGKNVLKLFGHMQVEGVLADNVTFANVLSACGAEDVELVKGQHIHAQILNTHFHSDDVIQNAILHMYGKCGVMEDAHSLFTEMGSRNLISWNSMITGAAQHGNGFSCLCLLWKMNELGVKPNTITFVGILTACSHAGLIVEAKYCLSLLEEYYGFTASIDHLNCMIDMLGRMGKLSEMSNLIVHMPFQPTGVSYTTLLNACKQHVQMDLGVFAAECAFEMIPEASALPLLMSNIYALYDVEDVKF